MKNLFVSLCSILIFGYLAYCSYDFIVSITNESSYGEKFIAEFLKVATIIFVGFCLISIKTFFTSLIEIMGK